MIFGFVDGNLSFALQRFGVKQKEKIASFKTSVDVLTLSATPIPRTLYLALTGFRDARLPQHVFQIICSLINLMRLTSLCFPLVLV